MELSVEVNQANGIATFICRGSLVRGQESDYLFDLVTRPDYRDVVLDVGGLSIFDWDGLSTLVLCHELLSSTNRKLFLRNPATELLLELRLRRSDFGTDSPLETRAAGVPGAIELVS